MEIIRTDYRWHRSDGRIRPNNICRPLREIARRIITTSSILPLLLSGNIGLAPMAPLAILFDHVDICAVFISHIKMAGHISWEWVWSLRESQWRMHLVGSLNSKICSSVWYSFFLGCMDTTREANEHCNSTQYLGNRFLQSWRALRLLNN